MPKWTAIVHRKRCHCSGMTSGGALLVLLLPAIGGLAAATLVVTVRGGRGPGDPPASRPRTDPAGFFVLSEQRGLLPRRPAHTRAARAPRPSRAAVAMIAAAVQTARESRTARRMSPTSGGRPSPSAGRTSVRLP